MKKRDIILILVLFFLAGVSYFLITISSHTGNRVIVTVDKKVVIDEPLSENQELTIPLTNGENTIVIKDGQVTMKEADCPDQICVKHKAISLVGESIICLPYRIVVTIEGDGESGYDN